MIFHFILAKMEPDLHLPHGKPQERVINVTHFLIRYGPGFLDAVFEQCQQWAGVLETEISGA